MGKRRNSEREVKSMTPEAPKLTQPLYPALLGEVRFCRACSTRPVVEGTKFCYAHQPRRRG